MLIKDLTRELDTEAKLAVHGGNNGNAANNTIATSPIRVPSESVRATAESITSTLDPSFRLRCVSRSTTLTSFPGPLAV